MPRGIVFEKVNTSSKERRGIKVILVRAYIKPYDSNDENVKKMGIVGLPNYFKNKNICEEKSILEIEEQIGGKKRKTKKYKKYTKKKSKKCIYNF